MEGFRERVTLSDLARAIERMNYYPTCSSSENKLLTRSVNSPFSFCVVRSRSDSVRDSSGGWW